MPEEAIIEQPEVAQEQFQQEPPDKTRKLYDQLYKTQLYTKSYDDFKKQYSNPEAIGKLYSGLKENDLYTKSQDEFASQYFDTARGTGLAAASGSKVQQSEKPLTDFFNQSSSPIPKQHGIVPVVSEEERQRARQEAETDRIGVSQLSKKAKKAQEDVINELHGNDQQYEQLIRQDRADAYTLDNLKKDYHDKGYIIPIGQEKKFLEAEKKRLYNQPVTPEDISDAKTGIILNEQGTRSFINKTGSKTLKANAYIVDAHNHAVGDPDANARAAKIVKNKAKIEKGEYDYDPETMSLIKPEGFYNSLVTSWHEKNKLFEDYDFYANTDKAGAINKLETDLKNHDPDDPIRVPEGMSGRAGAMIGGNPVAGLLAGGIAGAGTTALGHPEAAEQASKIAAATVSAYDFYRMGKASALKQNYNAFRQQGLSPEEAYNKAEPLSEDQARADAVSAAAMGFLGFESAFKPVGSISNAFKTSIMKGLTQIGELGAKKTLEGLGVGLVGSTGQLVKNIMAQQAGLPTDTFSGTGQQLEGGLMFTLGATLLAKASGLIRPKTRTEILQGLSKGDDATLQETFNKLEETGEIPKGEGAKLLLEVQEHRALDQAIPEEVNELNRLKIQAKIKERNILEEKIKATDKAFHEDLKERVKKLNEDILELSKPEEKTEASKLIDKAIKGNKFPEVYQETAQKDPEGFLKFIADQSLGRDENGTVMPGQSAESEMRKNFGDELVDKAKELYPLTQTETHAIQEQSSLNLPKNYGEYETNENLFPKRSHKEPAINRETASNIIGEKQATRLQTSLDWLEAIERNDTEAQQYFEKELHRQSIPEGAVLADNDIAGAQIRAQSGDGGQVGTKVDKSGSSSPQGSQRTEQPSGQLGASESGRTQQNTSQGTNARAEESIRALGETERRAVVEKIQQLSKLRNHAEKARGIRALRTMLEQALRENPAKTEEIVDLITENLPDHVTIRERIAAPTIVDETSSTGSEMGEGIPKPKEPATSQGGQEAQINAESEKVSPVDKIYELPFEEEAADKRTGIKNAISYKERYERTLPKVEVPKLGSDSEVLARGKELVDNGEIDPRAVVERVNATNEGMHPDEAKAMQYYMHQLGQHETNLREELAAAKTDEGKAEINGQLQQLSDEMDAATSANIKSGKAWSDVGNIRQIVVDPGFNPSRERAIIKDAYGGELPAKVAERLDAITKERDAAIAEKAKLEEALKNKAAEKVVEKIKQVVEKEENTKGKTKKEQLKKERDELLEELKKAIKKDTSAGYAFPFPVHTIEAIGKLALNYFKEGYITLEEITGKVFEDIKAHIPGATRKDVRDAISQYNPLRQYAKETSTEKLAAKEARIEKKLESGDIVPKKTTPALNFEKDTEWTKANQRVINAEFKLKEEKRKAFESQKNMFQKGLMWLGRLTRLSVLSGYGVLGKLASAATIGSAVKRIPEQVVGKIYSTIFSGIAKKAAIEGSPNIMAELKFYKEFFDPKKFGKNAWEILKTGSSELSKKMGAGEYEHVPVLYLPTDLHQIIKDPPKRATFVAAFKNAMTWAEKNGLDINDPLVIQAMETAAYKRAQYEIFQEKNWLSKKFSAWKASLEKAGNLGATGKFLADFMIPVSTVPTNIAKRLTSTSPLGLIRGSAMVVEAYRKGIENLSNEQADAVMRQLKQGSLGTALWLIGWFGYSSFGGLYSKFDPNKKRLQGDLESDQMEVDGKMVPKPVQHALPLEIIQLAATMRRIHDNYADRKHEDEFSSTYHAAMGAIGATIEQIPVLETGIHVAEAGSDPYAAEKLKEDVERRFEPQILRETGIIPKEEKKKKKR